MNELGERWEVPNSKCDLCSCIKPPNENWWEEHASAGGSGFNFTFCFECDKNRRGECDKVMCDCISSWTRKCREYWATHPEELERQRKETEEYRKTLVNGLPPLRLSSHEKLHPHMHRLAALLLIPYRLLCYLANLCNSKKHKN
jgi:hypothetical protein